jgi:hypothetical protein
MSIALITPTGGRPKQIQLCAEFMRKQDYKGKVLWVLVDDVLPNTVDCVDLVDFRKSWQIVKVFPSPVWSVGQNTQARNLLIGIEIVKNHKDVEAVFIIEDDDYYNPQYLSVMVSKLNGCDIVGQLYTVYYDPVHRGWMRNGNALHASLFQVAFRIEILPIFERICQTRKRFIDMEFFRVVKGRRINLFDGQDLAIGIKGLPGRVGIGSGHRMEIKMQRDPDFVKLKELIGEDYKYYL